MSYEWYIPRTCYTDVNGLFCNAAHQHSAKVHEETPMTIASDLLPRHLQTLVEDHVQWQTLIADDLVRELPYAPAIGHPARVSGREEVVRHVTWFLGAVEAFHFFDLKVYAFAD